MRLPAREYKRARIEIVPMIDTIFFLLVFFMIASLAMTRQTGMPVNLPKAKAAARDPVAKITITLTRSGGLYVDKRPMPLSALGAALQDQLRGNPRAVVVINADKQVRHGRVVAAMDEAKKAGATKMMIATQPATWRADQEGP